MPNQNSIGGEINTLRKLLREVKEIKNQVLIYIYKDGTVERKIIKND